MSLFDPNRHKLHLSRAKKVLQDHRFLYDDIGGELIDRLQDIKRNFRNVLNLSAHDLPFPQENHQITHLEPPYSDDLRLGEGQYDLIISNLAFHWVEEIVGLMVQIRSALTADGLFMASFYGGNTLQELRTSLIEAEMELTDGASLRTAPMIRTQDAPTLLGRAGFTLPVVDTENYTITYKSLGDLIRELRGMGETLKTREHSPASRKLFDRAEEIYFNSFAREDGTLPTTVEVITMTGWAPCSSQKKALKPGSASSTLEEALNRE